ncbi:hypothetical protein [Arcticibacter tournemirensis]
MRTSTIPGFREIFPNEQANYTDLVCELSSDTIIKLCAALNSELTCPEPRWEIQARLNFIVIQRFSNVQRSLIFRSFGRFKEKSGDGFQGMIFFRRYLVAMLLKELNNYRVVEQRDDKPSHEYAFFRAYLKIIDEVNDGDHADIDFKQLDKTDPLWVFRLCWPPMLRQFELNERGNMIFEMLKSACLMDFASKNFREPLKEYLSSFGFSSPGNLMGSFNAIYRATELYDPNAILKKYTLISINADTNTKHLEAQTITPQSNGKLRFGDLKKCPVFFSPQRQKHIVLDNYLAQRKVFRAPYFELFHKTSLKPQEKASQDGAYIRYSQQVADVLEKHCLKPILTLLAQQYCDVMHFDDGSDSVPDGYVRVGRKIFLFEYKAYFFPEKLSQKPNFEELKAYFDSRFITNEKGKEKGIHQLRKQISLICEGGFGFDREVKSLQENGSLIIYPIITYNDFYFGLNGLNVYLNNEFMRSLPEQYADKLRIVPVVLMNLESILDMVLTGQGVAGLEQHIHRFLRLASQAQEAMQVTGSLNDFLLAYSSFDELYNWQFAPRPGDLKETQEIFQTLLELTGLSLDELEEPID